MFQDENYTSENTYDIEENRTDSITENSESFAAMLEDYLPTPENTDKLKKPAPQWLKPAAVSFAICAVTLFLYSVIVIPHIKPAAVISYNNTENTPNNDENLPAVRYAADKILPSIVSVSGEASYRSFFGISTQTVSGTGIIISENGYILTSNSLLNTSGEATVTINKTDYTAKAVSQDPGKDIAVLQIDANELTPATLGNSESVHAGDAVIAAGNILGTDMGISVTRGIICGVNSNVSLQNGGTINLLQTDAVTDAGSTGGCLVNENGDVIGMLTTAISSGSEKISFAIPSNDIINIVKSVTSPNTSAPEGLIIGITGSDADHGVTVESVAEDTPASKAGIKVGDLILKVDGTPVKSVAEINKIRDSHKKGDTISLTIYRDGEINDVNITL